MSKLSADSRWSAARRAGTFKLRVPPALPSRPRCHPVLDSLLDGSGPHPAWHARDTVLGPLMARS